MEQHAIAVGSTFVWHELYAAEAQPAIDFYSKTLGWETEGMDMGEMGTYTMFKVNGTNVGGIMPTAGNPDMANVPPHWSIYISVDDVDARVAKAVENGATVLVPAMDIPTVGRMCLIKDPVGATVWFFKGTP